VRELRNVIESAVIMARGTVLRAEDLRLSRPEEVAAVSAAGSGLTIPAATTLADLEREALLQALRRHAGNRQLTATELGISTRTIQRKIREYALPF
jgi:two-component system response regulator HydG